MTSGVLGVIICPMVDDNLLYSLKKDPEEKMITLIDAGSASSLKRKFDKAGIKYDLIDWETSRLGGTNPSKEPSTS